MRKRRKISQVEARRLRRENEALRKRVDWTLHTPTPRWLVCNFTLTDAMARELQIGTRFGLRARAELTGNRVDVFIYRETEL